MAPEFIRYDYLKFPPDDQLRRAREFFELCNRRRTARAFSPRPISRELLETLIRTAGTAPSGANKQPWRFIIVTDAELKRKIRIAAEKEEKQNYERRMSQEWLDDLAILGTDWHKDFLEVAPALIVVFSIEYEKDGERTRKNYYVMESVGLAVGSPHSGHSQRWARFIDAHTKPDALPSGDSQPSFQRTTLRSNPGRLSG